MAVCCICNKKIGRQEKSHVFSAKYAELILCEKCNAHKQSLQVNVEGDIETIRESRQYFEDYLAINMVAAQAKEPLQEALKLSREAEEESLKYQRKNRNFLATTGTSFEGYRIVEYRDVVSGEVVLGTGTFTELGLQISDITGKTCETIAGKINAAKEQALFNLKRRAMLEGGNAVLGVSYDVVNLADNMLVVDARYSKALELNGFIQGDLGEYNAYLNKSGAFVRDIIMMTDEAEIAEAQQNLKDSDAKVDYYFTEFEHKLETDEERALTDLIKEKYPLYIVARDKAIESGLKNHNEAALNMFRDEAVPILQEVMDAADKLIAMNREMGDEVSVSLSFFSIIMVVIVVVVVIVAIVIAMKLATGTAKEIHDSVEKVQEATEKLANGELDVHVQIDSKDEFGEMAVHFNDAVDKLKLYIDTIKYGLTEVGAGNFAVKPPIEFHGDFVALKDAIVHITEALSSTMREINDGSEQVALGAEQLAENAQTLAEGATTQAAAIQELTATIENVTTAAEFNAKQADEACKSAESFAKLAEQSSQEMELLTQAMERITETSKEIESIIAEIEDIASQTNLLSLNASIEAARAGEAGRGFAVVADQIGKLATDSAQSAVNTNSLIAKSLQEINAGNEITARTVKALQEVIQGIRTLAVASQQSRELSAEQAETMGQVQQGIIQIADVVQSNSASAEETSATSEELSAQSQNLKAMVDQFTLLEENVNGL